MTTAVASLLISTNSLIILTTQPLRLHSRLHETHHALLCCYRSRRRCGDRRARTRGSPCPVSASTHKHLRLADSHSSRNGDAYSLVQRDIDEPGLWERALEALGVYARARGTTAPKPDPTYPKPPPEGHHRFSRRTEADLQARVDEAVELFARHRGTNAPKPDTTYPRPPSAEGHHHWSRRTEADLQARVDEAAELLARGGIGNRVWVARPKTRPTGHPGGFYRRSSDDEELLARGDDEAAELLARGGIGNRVWVPRPKNPGGHPRIFLRSSSDDEELLARFDDDDTLLARAFDDEELFARFDDEDLFARNDDEDLFARFDGGLEIEELD